MFILFIHFHGIKKFVHRNLSTRNENIRFQVFKEEFMFYLFCIFSLHSVPQIVKTSQASDEINFQAITEKIWLFQKSFCKNQSKISTLKVYRFLRVIKKKISFLQEKIHERYFLLKDFPVCQSKIEKCEEKTVFSFSQEIQNSKVLKGDKDKLFITTS